MKEKVLIEVKSKFIVAIHTFIILFNLAWTFSVAHFIWDFVNEWLTVNQLPVHVFWH